jgi:D-tyrosyl-tRNA(Tyr) deacylase
VTSASVTVGERPVGSIEHGLLVLVGAERGDAPADAHYIADKVRDLRIFEDPAAGKHLNRSVQDVGGAVLVVSQFTLAADCRKGRRPSFDDAETPALARPLVDAVIDRLRGAGLPVETGEFQAAMRVALINDGPVTVLLDSRKRF